MELRPSIINAIIPEALSRVIVPGAIISGLAWLIARYTPSDSLLGVGAVSAVLSAWWFYAIVWGILFLPFAWVMLLLSRTKYVFGASAVTREFSLVSIRRLTVPYDKIVHIGSDISIWDRISGAGDVSLRTAEEDAPDLILRFVPNPQKVEKMLIDMIR